MYSLRPSSRWFSESCCLRAPSSALILASRPSESCLFMATTRETDKRMKWEGEGSVFWCVCGVCVHVQCLFCVVCDAACWTRDWFIVLFACCPGKTDAACWLKGEMVRKYEREKPYAFYYMLFEYVYGGVFLWAPNGNTTSLLCCENGILLFAFFM